jgi:hypothetical protein
MSKRGKQAKCPLCEKTIKACDKSIENLHKHYEFLMQNLSPIREIKLSYADDNDMHFCSWISIKYVKKGRLYEKTERFAPGTGFSKGTLVATFNKLLEQILSENSYNGGT